MIKKALSLLAILIVLFIGYNLIGQILGALRSEERLSQAAWKLHGLEVKNKELKKQLSEIKSTDFIEKTARDKLGLAREGETVVVIPEEALERVLGEAKKIEEIRLPNWQGWLRVFFK